MRLRENYDFTMVSCFIGYITQAITVNLPPLLFVMFMTEYGLPFSRVTALITFTFTIQLIIDLLLSRFLNDKTVKALAFCAQLSAVVGLICLAFLPDMMEDKFTALIISAFFYSSGSGIIEVAVSPIAEACPTKNKSAAMSLLHSFYCWGSAFTIGLTTLFFALFGEANWRLAALLWAIVPAVDGILMLIMPIGHLESQTDRSRPIYKNPIFYILFALMLLGGAAELSVSQWASAFAETGLCISKSAGDIAGPFMFAILMGTGRVVYSIIGDRVRLTNYMLLSACLLTAGFLLAAFSPVPFAALIGTALCGLSVAIFWPGTVSLSMKKLGTSSSLFGLLAFAGDTGCTLGPMFVGAMSQQFGQNISAGLGSALVFPIGMLILVLVIKTGESKTVGC